MNNLDQFYTRPLMAELCTAFLKRIIRRTFRRTADDYFFIEPSAGDGAFYRLLPPARRLGIDLDPKCGNIQTGDFFKYKYMAGKYRVIVIGNPPFGKNSSVAVKFFNHAASFPEVDIIAFIVPKTFRKISIQNRLVMNFHLVDELDLPDESFLKDGNLYKVPCVFQVWIRLPTKRTPVKVDLNNDWFDFVDKHDNPDLAVRRVGFNAGACKIDLDPCNTTTFYFLRLKPTMNKTNFWVHVNALRDSNKFLSVIGNTAGPRSLSKGEFLKVLRENPFSI
jgi:hypothetical protein